MPVLAACLEEQHRTTGVGGEPVGEDAAGGAGADDDVVVGVAPAIGATTTPASAPIAMKHAIAGDEGILQREHRLGPRRMLAENAGDVAAAAASSVMPALGESVGRLGAEADEDHRRAAAREVTEHGNDDRPPQRQMAAQLVRVALHREAAQRERRVEEKDALPYPAVGDLRRRLEVDAVRTRCRRSAAPSRRRADVAGIAGSRGGDRAA